MFLPNNEILIHDGNPKSWKTPTVDGDKKKHGLIPRDYTKHPVGCYAGIPAFDSVSMKLVPQGDWAGLAAHKAEAKTRLSDLRNRGMNGRQMPSRDQNGRGYCWAHSGVSCHLMHRAKLNLPYADLSAYAIACVIKNFADQGGWGAQGVDWQIKYGCPTSKTWPQRGTARNLVTDAMYAEAARYKVTGGFIDLQAAQYDRNLTWAQVVTCLLTNNPVVLDYNWWSHSVAGADVVDGARQVFPVLRAGTGKHATLREFELVWDMHDQVTAGMGVRIWNSWGDGWGDAGMGVLTPQKSVPDGSVALTDTLPSEDAVGASAKPGVVTAA